MTGDWAVCERYDRVIKIKVPMMQVYHRPIHIWFRGDEFVYYAYQEKLMVRHETE
jgi:hypothetical protein